MNTRYYGAVPMTTPTITIDPGTTLADLNLPFGGDYALVKGADGEGLLWIEVWEGTAAAGGATEPIARLYDDVGGGGAIVEPDEDLYAAAAEWIEATK